MANEATIQAVLTINKTVGGKQIKFNNLPAGAFTADVSGAGGPSPGAIPVAAQGTALNLLTYLTKPGLYTIYNSGLVAIDWGVYEPTTGKAYLMNALLPSESYVGRFSPYLFGDVPGAAGTGTGTIGTDNNQLFFRARGAGGYVTLLAFDE